MRVAEERDVVSPMNAVLYWYFFFIVLVISDHIHARRHRPVCGRHKGEKMNIINKGHISVILNNIQGKM